jgi:radical SAM-linked protein
MQENSRKYFTVKFIFSKTGFMRYISHLDLMRLLMRAARRADLPLYFTEGFSPHPKLRIARALKLGLESENEEAEIVLTRRIDFEAFQHRLNKQLPQGVRIKEVINATLKYHA